MSRFLVTGGRGFIGSALVRHLISAGHHVLNLDLGTYAAVPGALDSVVDNQRYTLIDGSISDRSVVDSALEDFKPRYVVNLAAETHVDRSIDHPAPFVDSNVVGVVVLLETVTGYWKKLAPKDAEVFRFIHVSTDEVFGSIDDDMATPGTSYNPSSPYAASKAASDHMTRAWHRTFGLPAIVTNCSNNYGPYQFPEKLIPLAIVRALTGQNIPIYGDGKQVRDWIHVDDHCRGLVTVCNFGAPGETYLIGARSALLNLEVIEKVCSHLDRLAPRTDDLLHATAIEHVIDRPGHDRRYSIDPTSIERLGFRVAMGLDEGVNATVEWYVNNRSWWQSILELRYDTARIGVLS